MISIQFNMFKYQKYIKLILFIKFSDLIYSFYYVNYKCKIICYAIKELIIVNNMFYISVNNLLYN